MMRSRWRAFVLLTTALAWALPMLLAMRLYAARIVEPYVDPHLETYARTYVFQYLMFWIRYGSWLLLAFLAVLTVQVKLTSTRDEPRNSPTPWTRSSH